ncbi:GNAT family N-acetyltransferase [Streptomyces sp. NBC_00582]|uniref:GNAT family N-acetyltransferase n=1 Tax=Streptomyces sp. NBC_00582 TaxID=2975783 RepID=UPI002E81D935|nr:GNAT family N-acetyltransferase [Streptomyces sp. NBC_00582]WUB68362.1 GNAT family N-acetyltransferase [Streptomyces sp. NBC_00582]
MSLTALSPNSRAVTSTWHSSVVALPAERPAATPFHTREWAAAWQAVRTEQVRSRHHLFLHDGPRQHRMSFYQVSNSPLWHSMEGDAGVTRPTFEADVLYSPSAYGEYGGLPGAAVSVLGEAVDRGRALARDLGTEALVIANIPPAERTLWNQARTPDAEVVLSWAHRARVGASVDEFIANFPSSTTSRAFRSEHRRGTDAGLTLKIARGIELLPYIAEFASHAGSASRNRALYGTDMFTPLTRVPGAVGLLAEHRDGTLAGGFFCFRYGSALYLWTAAVDARNRDLPVYSWLMHESVKFAVDTGASVLDAGRFDYAYKARLGMLPVALTSAVYLTRPNPHLISRLGALHTGLNQHVLRAWNKA